MNLAIIHSRARTGVDAPPVTVEVHLSNGLPSLSIVGLPETAVKESKDRVRAAIINSRFEFPARRITVNLAPADLPKEGGRFDLPIALGILAASAQIPVNELQEYEFLGELGLGGGLRPVVGVLPAALAAHRAGKRLFVPRDNADEAALVSGACILPAGDLLQICAHLAGRERLQAHERPAAVDNSESSLDLADVVGQHRAKRALEIAGAGRHNLLMLGPPGTGKTMLASRLPTLLPPMSEDEALEVAAIRSISHLSFDPETWLQRPFRAPHHTASGIALVGGGSNPRPGEISLAHNGVLFLDELTEFDRRVLEVLREPLENGAITISRAARQARFPARFQLIAAMNPCPQGYDCDLGPRCRCTPEQQRRHRSRISAPLLDRIDMHIVVPRVTREALRAETDSGDTQGSTGIAARVRAARERQLLRQDRLNADLGGRRIDDICALAPTGERLLDRAAERFGLSTRACHRIQKVARTIADLAGSDRIGASHLSEAISYRTLERLM